MAETTEYERHELSTIIFGDMPDDEFNALVAEIREDGLMESSIITLDGKVLYDWDRYRASIIVDAQPIITPYEGNDPVTSVMRIIKGLEFTALQKASMAVVADQWRSGGRGVIQSRDDSGQFTVASGGARTNEQLAEFVGVSTRQIQHARKAERFGFGQAVRRGDINRDEIDKIKGEWDAFILHAKLYVETGGLQRDEIPYKTRMGERLAAARDATLSGADDWIDLVKAGIASGGGLVHNIQQSRFRNWLDEYPDDSIDAIRELWTAENLSIPERIRAFSGKFPRLALGTLGVNTRLTVISALLMGLDARQYPPFRMTPFNKAYTLTGYEAPNSEADEATVYTHTLGFLDRFIEEAGKRGLTLNNRLEAQSVVWRIHDVDVTSHDFDTDDAEETIEPEPSLGSLADDLNLHPSFLQEIQTLLEDKLQVIFQGPPGTGKTYVAQALARHLAGSGDRVSLVQFHPSYDYVDFAQGFRPTLTDGGQAGFELRDGPLIRAADRARNEPDAKHFLIIDEINRGNLAKVFGELYFLLEYRDAEINLQYSDKSFSLPPNLYIIGTMNTADRSIALVDLALRRRFYFVEFDPSEEPIKGLLRRWLADNAPGMGWVADAVDAANDLLSDDQAAIGPSYFMKEGLDDADVERIWKHAVLPYVAEQLFGEPERLAEFALDRLRPTDAASASESE